jgi:hypothetical protein
VELIPFNKLTAFFTEHLKSGDALDERISTL